MAAGDRLESDYRQAIVDICKDGFTKEKFLKLRVASESMLPFIRVGDELFVEPYDANLVRRGELIVFRSEQELITHRVIYSRNGIFQTKGDNLAKPDEIMENKNIIGRVYLLERNEQQFDLLSLHFTRINRLLGWLGWTQVQCLNTLEQLGNRFNNKTHYPWVVRAFLLAERLILFTCSYH